MIPLGLRLAIRGGRETMIRLVMLVLAVGLGTGLLLAAVSGINAFSTQSDASAWLQQGHVLGKHRTAPPGTAPFGGTWRATPAAARASPASTSPRPVPPHPCRRGFRETPGPVGITRLRRWPRCCTALPRTNSPTATRVTWPARSARPRCRHPALASAEMKQSLVAPGPEYYLITVAGVAISVAIIAATFPLLRRITGPEAARNE